MIPDAHNSSSKNPALTPHQTLRHRLPPMPKPPEHNLTVLNLPHPTPFLDLAEKVTRKLRRRLVRAPVGLAEAEVAGRQGQHGVPVGAGERHVRVVLVGQDVEMVGFGEDLLEVGRGPDVEGGFGRSGSVEAAEHGFEGEWVGARVEQVGQSAHAGCGGGWGQLSGGRG